MPIYIPFTEKQKRQARETNLVELLRGQGEVLKRCGSEYEWLDRGQKVTIRGNLFYHQYEQWGGDAIEFICKFYHMSYAEAVNYLTHGKEDTLNVSCPVPREVKSFSLPKRHENMRRVFAYLVTQRGIDRNVVHAFAHAGLLYESVPHHNVVFVGLDKEGVPRHAHKRSTGKENAFKCNQSGSQAEYSFHWIGCDECLYLFEAPIDLLSYISMHQENWRRHSYAAACSVSDRVLFQLLADYPNLKKAFLCFDSDEPGQAAAKRIADSLFVQGYSHEILIPIRKDWNEDLLVQKRKAI